MNLAGDNGLFDLLFLTTKTALLERREELIPLGGIFAGQASSHRVIGECSGSHDESARSGRQYCAVFSYAHDGGVDTDQLSPGYREHRGSANR
jgi:hypothetical protein